MSTIHDIAASLTHRDKELIREIALGFGNILIGEHMHHETSTISSYRKDLFPIINCTNAVQVAMFARETKIITREDGIAFWDIIERTKIRNEFHR